MLKNKSVKNTKIDTKGYPAGLKDLARWPMDIIRHL